MKIPYSHNYYIHKPIKIGPISTSNIEITEILKAWLLVSLAFGIVMAGFSLTKEFALALVVAAFTVGMGFLLHELAHKLVAQQYGAFAEFRAFDQMLILAVVMSFFGFVFVAPGAVFIHAHLNKTKNGIVSLAGPLTNLVLALLFFSFKIFFPFWPQFIEYGFLINAWLALFNLVPFFNFDGQKILSWSKGAYFSMLVICGFLVFAGYVF
jgi:Zn-dependent protease